MYIFKVMIIIERRNIERKKVERVKGYVNNVLCDVLFYE